MVLTHPWSELKEGEHTGACTDGSTVTACRQAQDFCFRHLLPRRVQTKAKSWCVFCAVIVRL